MKWSSRPVLSSLAFHAHSHGLPLGLLSAQNEQNKYQKNKKNQKNEQKKKNRKNLDPRISSASTDNTKSKCYSIVL